MSVIGRCLIHATDASPYEGFFGRLGIRANLTETTSAKVALRNLLAAMSAERPAIALCDRSELPLYGKSGLWADTCTYAVVVYGVDDAGEELYVDDQAAGSLTVPLDVVIKAHESSPTVEVEIADNVRVQIARGQIAGLWNPSMPGQPGAAPGAQPANDGKPGILKKLFGR